MRLGASILLIGAALSAPGALRAESWCDYLFKDVSATAPNVFIARFHAPRGERARIELVEVLKGAGAGQILGIGPEALRALKPRDGDLFVLALDLHHRLLSSMEEIGACAAISILPVRGGRLRGSDRGDYDGGRRPMTLDELRADLVAEAGASQFSHTAATALAGM